LQQQKRPGGTYLSHVNKYSLKVVKKTDQPPNDTSIETAIKTQAKIKKVKKVLKNYSQTKISSQMVFFNADV
jgi:hypothetical protein